MKNLKLLLFISILGLSIDADAQWSNVTGGIHYSSGKVGIGTSNFGSTTGSLFVGNPLHTGSGAVAQFNGFIRTGYLIMHEGTTSNTALIRYDANGLSITSGLEGVIGRKISLTGGNVGIGTASPSATLHVNGSFRVTHPGTNQQVLFANYADNAGILRLYDAAAETTISIRANGTTYFTGGMLVLAPPLPTSASPSTAK